MKHLFSGSGIILGMFGLGLSVLGEVTALGDYKNLAPRSGEKFAPELVIQTPDLASLKDKLRSSLAPATTHQEKMLITYNLVINRFTHGNQAKYNIFSNWLLWLMGGDILLFRILETPM